MKKQYGMSSLLSGIITILLMLPSVTSAASTVVVVPLLGGAVGNATAVDVVQGKTFSSKAGKGLTGTLELPPTMQTYTTPTYSMTFNLIPAGTFTMGSPDDEPGGPYPNETQHQVTLTASYYMQTTEVTQQQWRDVVLDAEAAGYLAVGLLEEEPSWSHGGEYYSNYPVERVSWNNILDWLNALNQLTGKSYKLPTEAQWEYAARATTTTAWAYLHSYDTSPTGAEPGVAFNSNLAAMGWYYFNDTSYYPSMTKPVAKKQPNKWGLYDMHGNVWEYCQDWFADDYYTDPDSGVDPQGPVSGSRRVMRSGTWNHSAKNARSAYRGSSSPDVLNGTAGFRLILPPGQ